ncbi:MAG: hypothetical protein HQL87_12785 [Magnetococcales bacterium]|nr:hypothetical protein [Magnetococcales bacterium]
MRKVEYLTDGNGQKKAVVVPIALWRQILPQDDGTEEALSETMADYCLGKAMDEAKEDLVYNKTDAMAYLAK